MARIFGRITLTPFPGRSFGTGLIESVHIINKLISYYSKVQCVHGRIW